MTASLPEELKVPLNQLGREQIIEDARRDIELFAQKLSFEQIRAEARQQPPLSSIHYNIHINENRVMIQQGGSGNLQSTSINDDEAK